MYERVMPGRWAGSRWVTVGELWTNIADPQSGSIRFLDRAATAASAALVERTSWRRDRNY